MWSDSFHPLYNQKKKEEAGEWEKKRKALEERKEELSIFNSTLEHWLVGWLFFRLASNLKSSYLSGFFSTWDSRECTIACSQLSFHFLVEVPRFSQVIFPVSWALPKCSLTQDFILFNRNWRCFFFLCPISVFLMCYLWPFSWKPFGS